MDPYYLYRDRKPNPLQELGTSNLDAAEFIGALERSLHLEFLAAVGAPRERPQINLRLLVYREKPSATSWLSGSGTESAMPVLVVLQDDNAIPIPR